MPIKNQLMAAINNYKKSILTEKLSFQIKLKSNTKRVTLKLKTEN